MSKIRRWWRMLGIPHTCGDCGRPLTYGHNKAGRWWVACGKVELVVGDRYLERNFESHTVRVIGSRPEWTCDHEHIERESYSPTVGWWE